MRPTLPLLATILLTPAPAAPVVATFVGASTSGVARPPSPPWSGSWVRFVGADAARVDLRPLSGRVVLTPGPSGDERLVLSDGPLDCAALQEHHRRLGAAAAALRDAVERAGGEVALADVCSLVDAVVEAGPATTLPREDGAWTVWVEPRARRTDVLAVRWEGWAPAAGWDPAACAFSTARPWTWRGRQDVWAARWASATLEESDGRLRGTVRAVLDRDGPEWSLGYLSARFDVAVCEVEAGPTVSISMIP